MKKWVQRVALLGCLGTGAIFGCNKNTDSGLVSVSSQKLEYRDMMAYIPQDTPYLFMNFASMPKAMLEKKLTLSSSSVWDELVENEGIPEWIHALFKEVSFKSLKDLERLGIDCEGKYAIYGLGLFPVLRIELKDPTKMKEALGRIEAASREKWEVKQLGGQAYWNFALDDAPISGVLALVKNELVMTLMPVKDSERWLKYAFLQEKPANGFTDTKALEKLAKDVGLSAYGVGYIDNKILGDIFLWLDKGLNGDSWASFFGAEDERYSVSEVCQKEIKSLISVMPRFSMGIPYVDDHRQDVRGVLELRQDIAQGLSGITYNGGGMGAEGKLGSFSLGINTQKAIEFAQQQAAKVKAEPYQCEYLTFLNEAAQGIASFEGEKMAMIPGGNMLTSFTGFSVVVDDLKIKEPLELAAKIFIGHSQPEALLTMLTMFNPKLATLGVKADGKLVDVTAAAQENGLPKNLSCFEMMTNEGIAASIGAGQEKGLADFMKAQAAPGTVIKYNVNGVSVAQILQSVMDDMKPSENQTEIEKNLFESEMKLFEGYRNMMRAYEFGGDVKLNSKGVEFNMSSRLK